MIEAIIVKLDDQSFACSLVGFGGVLCGNCRAPMHSNALKTKCVRCGAKVVEVKRAFGRNFEGTMRVGT